MIKSFMKRMVLLFVMVTGVPVFTGVDALAGDLQERFGLRIFHESKGRWAPDKVTGCKVYNASPQDNETVSWSGQCVDGKASGNGVLQWYVGGAATDKYEGAMLAGQKSGVGTSSYSNGSSYIGAI